MGWFGSVCGWLTIDREPESETAIRPTEQRNSRMGMASGTIRPLDPHRDTSASEPAPDSSQTLRCSWYHLSPSILLETPGWTSWDMDGGFDGDPWTEVSQKRC